MARDPWHGASPAERLAVGAAAHELDRQYQYARGEGGPYLYGYSPDHAPTVSVDGPIDPLLLLRAAWRGSAQPASVIPELAPNGTSQEVLLQWGSRPDITRANYDPGCEHPRTGEVGSWIGEHGIVLSDPVCWWPMPPVLSPDELIEVGISTSGPREVELTPEGGRWEGSCRKCGAESGNDWSQCDRFCPLPISPHYDADTATRLLLEPRGAG